MPAHATLPWLYLASQSPRRRQLLDQLGVSHHLLLPDAHEDAEALEAERVGESPEDYVQRVTFAKWEAACARLVRRRAAVGHDWADAPILCADTTVALGDQILAKPVDDADAARMLGLLQGKGWLERQPHAEDRRSLCLTLSAEGQALYQALQAARQTLSAQVLAGCDDATQAQLLALLARVRSNLDALPPLETGEDCSHGRGRSSR